jgi:AAA family ATP:ADP antiporter
MFKPEEARKYFGYITAGGTIGGIMGSKLTHYLSTKIQVENLLYFASIMLILTIVCMKLLLKLKRDFITDNIKKDLSSDEPLIKNGFNLIWNSSYLKWMLLASFLTSSGATLLYNLMNAIVKYNITDKALRTAYWADVYQWINIFGLIFQLFGVYIFVRYLGMLPALLIAPLTDLAGSLLLIPSQTLFRGRIYYAGHFSTEYSFNRASSEMLYTPTDKNFKYQAKAIIDTFICRFGEGITNLLIIFTGLSLQNMVFLSFSISLVRILPAIALVKHYKILTNKSE